MTKEIQTYNPTEDVVVYRSEDDSVQLDVQLAEETVWLTQQQISALFHKAKSTISYHISNIFKEGELDEKVVVRKIRITTPHGAMSDRTQTDELNLAGDKFNAQYKGLSIHQINNIHDRFLILDDKTIYLIGASLKDAGKKLFAFTEISVGRIEELKKLL